MMTYLRTGIEAEHGAAAGPMGPVAHGLSELPEAEVRAIATYVVSRMGQRAARAPLDREAEAARTVPQGAALFAGACGSCHGVGTPMLVQGRPSLMHAGDLQHDDPRNTIQAMLQGIAPPVGRAGPYMPGYADALTDAQLASLAAYLRARYTERAPWPDLVQAVGSARKEASAP
jgi:mono/diheme cytochrome c family protein